MKTRHPVEGQFGSEFPAICYHCKVTVVWSRKTLTFCEQFLRFLAKTTPFGKIFKILFRKFSPLHWSCVFKCRKICLTGNQWNRALFTWQKISCISKCRYCADLSQNLPGQAPNNVLIALQIISKSVHFRWSSSWTRESRSLAHGIFFQYFFVSVPCARLSWPFRQLFSARKSTVSYSYRIASYALRAYEAPK